MATLRQTLNDLAASFASNVLEAIRGASLEDLVPSAGGRTGRASALGAAMGALSSSGADGARSDGAMGAPRARRGRGGRLARRSSGDIAQVIDGIVGLLRQNPRGLRAEQIRQKLGMEAKELPRPLKEALEGGKLSKVGQKRATTYFAKGAGGAVATASAARVAGGRRGKRSRPAKSAKRGKARGTRKK
jgi:hypothetical protein